MLGCILWSPTTALPECEARISDSDAFYDLRHQTIYNAMCALSSEMIPIELISLQQRLKDDQLLDQVGGIVYLSSLQDAVPSAANLSYYLDVVMQKFTLRKLIQTCSNIVGRAYENEGEGDVLMDEAERDILQIRPSRHGQRDWKAMLRAAVDRIEARHNHDGAITGIPTGLKDLDRHTDGLHPGKFIVVAAYPGVGKSALVGNIADSVAVENNLPVGIFSMEMPGEEYAERMISTRARVNLRSKYSEQDFKRMTAANLRLAKAPIHLLDPADLTIGQLRAEARKLKQQHDIKLWIVDYLQLLCSPEKAKQSREQEVADISHGLKAMAKELNAPVIGLSQLNDDGKLRESRAIGQDADMIWVLNRVQDADKNKVEMVDLFIDKQRGGDAKINVPLVFLKQFTRFECPALISDEDVPTTKKPYND